MWRCTARAPGDGVPQRVGGPVRAPAAAQGLCRQCVHRVVQGEGGRVDVGPDHGPPPTPQVDQSLVAERLIRAQDRVHVDVQACRHLPGRWQLLAGRHRAVGQRTTDLRSDLVGEADRTGGIHAEQHSFYSTRTIDIGAALGRSMIERWV